MSHRMTPRGLVSLGEGRQRYNRVNPLFIWSFAESWQGECGWGLYRLRTFFSVQPNQREGIPSNGY